MIFRITVWVIFLFGGTAAGIIWDINIFPATWHNWIWHIISFFIGLLLLITTMKISKNTGRTLAKYGREGKVKRMDTNRLVKTGVYKCMRHPMHLGLFLFPFAFAFLSGSLTFILFIAPIEVVFMIIMVLTLEEKEAIHKFGNNYIEYKKEVPAFNLSRKCLKELLKTVK